MSEDPMQTVCVSAWRPILVASGLLCLVACGDGSSGRTAPTPTVTPLASPTVTPSPFEGRVFAIGSGMSTTPFAVARSEHGGQEFERVFDTDAFGGGARGLTFVDATRGWAIASSFPEMPRILHTVDGGLSWVDQTENIVVEDKPLLSLADIAFSSAERGVAVGVFRQDLQISAPPVILVTTDGGEKWRSVPFSRAATLRSVCLAAGGTGLAVGSSVVSGPLVVRTDDGGATWRDITTELGLFLDADLRTVACTETGQFWIGGESVRRLGLMPGSSDETVIFSPDDGDTWLSRSPPALANTQDAVTSLASVDALNGWALAQGHTTVFHTDDAGATWIEQALPVAADSTSSVNALDFRDSERGVVVGGIAGAGSLTRAQAFFTADGGSTWLRAAVVPEETGAFRDVAFPPD